MKSLVVTDSIEATDDYTVVFNLKYASAAFVPALANPFNWIFSAEKLKADPFSGQLFVFRDRRGDLVKMIWWDGQGMCLFYKRLERGRFVWPTANEGKVRLSPAQLSMLLEGIDWRMAQSEAMPKRAA